MILQVNLLNILSPWKDIILNPLDALSPRWSLWNEIRTSYDYVNIVEG